MISMPSRLLYIVRVLGRVGLVAVTLDIGQVSGLAASSLNTNGDRSVEAGRLRVQTSYYTAIGRSVGVCENDVDISRNNKVAFSFRLSSCVGPIDSLDLANNNLLVVHATGRTGPVEEITIIDAANLRIRDKFWCFDPVMSPNGRYLAFKKFYTPHGAESDAFYSESELIYDFDKSHMANIDSRRDDSWDDGGQVGQLVYPSSSDLLPDPRAKGTVTVYQFPTFFFWSPDSTKFVFMERHWADPDPDGDENPPETVDLPQLFGLVFVDLANGHPVTRYHSLGQCGGGNSSCAGTLMSVSFSPGKFSISVKSDLDAGSILREDVALSDFIFFK